MKKIPLSAGKSALVDDSDYDTLMQWKWTYFKTKSKSNKTYGYAGRMDRTRLKPLVLMHRFLLDAPRGMVVDHIDGRGTNNQRHNIRLCTQSENMFNQPIPKHNKTGIKGAHIYKKSNKYRSMIGWRGKRIHLGYFKTAKEAGRAYKKAAISLYGHQTKQL